ncbi:P-loop containing nucleoside triphosphate hydrolase protein [Setomelanomma holmii]|uniref:small monomeric GTPase n=1 Tax=Setomelanomma holmii TaxID=210430 RepID=A0A9P4H5Z3_9PLEO|nr:P-loop containing nucleoside triphosphate hydrolase protein [Setomelanomma holmii]
MYTNEGFIVPAPGDPPAEGIVVFGEARVGKTCFIDMLTQGRHFVSYTGVLTEDPRHRMVVDNEPVHTEIMDLSSTIIRNADATFASDMFMDFFTRASGVVLLYDITDLASFEHITNQAYMYVWMCKRCRGVKGSCEFVLVGNKADVLQTQPRKREVDTELAEQWAQSQGMRHFEITTNERELVQDVVHALVRAMRRAKRRSESERDNEEREAKYSKSKEKSRVELNRTSLKDKIRRVVDKRGDA